MALGMVFFFNNCSLATPFETLPAPQEKQKFRLPTSTGGQTLKFDCAQVVGNKMEVSTAFETIRIEAVNCENKVSFKDEVHHQSLVIFPLGEKKFASELAYLMKGNNAFSITVADKTYQLLVERF